MLCPRCGTENNLEQNFCRQCGLALSTLRLALEGHIDKAMVKLKQARKTLLQGTGFTASQILILILGHLIGAVGSQALILTPFDLIVFGMIIVIGLPLIIKGVVEIERANNLLSGKDPPGRTALGHLERSAIAFPSDSTTNSLDAKLQFPDAVTEQTTIHLADHPSKGE